MAYTYDNFVSAAKNAGLYDSFSPQDLSVSEKNPEYGLSLLKLQRDASKATTEEQKLLVQEATNQLRGTYGIYGNTTPGVNAGDQKAVVQDSASQLRGTDSTPPSTSTAGSFAYSGETDYQKLLESILNPGEFDYNHKTDPAYGALKESWTSDTDRTTENILGATTVPQNDWAGAAAQQAGNYSDAKINDLIPMLHQNAYTENMNNYNNQLSQLAALAKDKNFDLSAYLQQLQLDQAAAQQKFTNDMTLNQEFGTEAPTLPDLDGLTPGTDTQYKYGKDSEYQQALDAVVNQDPFSYDHTSDPLYGSLRKSSMREGDRAAANKLAQLNARTGGVASSYGVRAASDIGNGYNEQLNGQIPGLRSNAYQEYLGDFNQKLQGLNALEEDRAVDYESWLGNYKLQQAAKQQEFENALALYRKIGLTPEIAAVLGVPYGGSDDGGEWYGDASGLSYGQIRDDFFTQLGQGATEQEAAKFLEAAVNQGFITGTEAGKIASGYTAGERMWDRHG